MSIPKSQFILKQLVSSMLKYGGRDAIWVSGQAITYSQLAVVVSSIRSYISKPEFATQQNIGIVTTIDHFPYACIIALWLEGKTYVPVNPVLPMERNISILEQAEIKTILGIAEQAIAEKYKCIDIAALPPSELKLELKETTETDPAYILFTSGTTGLPKGVPVTMENLSYFIQTMYEMGYELNETDRCLQMFDLTFDLSIVSYLLPFLSGACLYLIPNDKIKFLYIYELLEEEKITVATMVPSVLHQLKKYFDEIQIDSLRFCFFCGEALHLDITESWGRCVPNAEIVNFYGPTENTIWCTYYIYQRKNTNKERNGILSIGKPLNNTDAVVVDPDGNILHDETVGELCLLGKQLTTGYWKNDEKNAVAFFVKEINGFAEKLYRTGDICVKDKESDILYLGRIDSQVKIQGYRVELSEIEYRVKTYLPKNQVTVIAFENSIGNTEIGLTIEGGAFDTEPVMSYLKSHLPSYMYPSAIKFCNEFPLNVNGKIDKNKIRKLFI